MRGKKGPRHGKPIRNVIEDAVEGGGLILMKEQWVGRRKGGAVGDSRNTCLCIVTKKEQPARDTIEKVSLSNREKQKGKDELVRKGTRKTSMRFAGGGI